MKARVAIIILVLVAVGLGIGLMLQHNEAVEEKRKDVASILGRSNDVVLTRGKLEEQQTVNLTLETNLSQNKLRLESISNELTQTAATLSKVQAEAKAAAEASAAEMAKRDAKIAERDAKIAELQGQNDDMTKKMTDLNGAITGLEKQIADTEKRLATSEGDKAFLLKELQRLQAEKAALEKQFNDLAILREQVRKLRDELSISRRLEWIRQGIYGRQNEKGGQTLLRMSQPAAATTNNSSLNVELKQAKPTGTNAPPPK